MMSFVSGRVSRYDSNVTDSDNDSEDGDKEGSPKPVKKKPPVSNCMIIVNTCDQ